MLSDQAMFEILLPKGLEVSDIVDPLLKFANEPRSERIELDSSLSHLNNKEEMVFRSRRERRFVNGDLKVDRGSVARLGSDEFVSLVGEIDGFLIEENISFQLFFIELDTAFSLRTLEMKFFLQKEMGEDFHLFRIHSFAELTIEHLL